jgi:hypothetical protein
MKDYEMEERLIQMKEVDSTARRNRRFAILVVAVMIIIFLMSESFVLYSEGHTSSGSVTDYSSFIDNLQSAGVTARSAGEIPKTFFSVKGQTILINDQHLVMVFEYPDAASADADAALVSPDGGSIGTAKPFWGSTPHFYKRGRLIVLYVGGDENVTKILVSILGPQFAGG